MTQSWTHIVRNTLLVAGSFGLAAVAGLVRNMVIAQQFGLGAELDAYYAAFKLPDLLFTIVAGGALATAFIPVFADVLANEGRMAAWRLAAAITNMVVLVVLAFATLTAIFAPWLVENLIAPGFNPSQQAETVSLMRIVLFSTLVFGISSVQSGVLHGFKHFLLPALAPAIYPAGVIVGAVWLSPTYGIHGLAWGAVLGAVLHLLIKIPALLYYGLRWWPVLDLRRETVQQVLVLMGPRVIDLGVFHLTLLATTNLASRLDAGSVSAIEWGWDAMQLPETIIGTAFGLVAFPTLAQLAAQKKIAELRHTLAETLRAIIALTVPAACGLILLGRPMLALLYQRGAFTAEATEAVLIALQFFALGLVGHACLEVAARAFFAQKDTITPLFVAIGSAVGNILLGILLMGWLGHGGLALANSIAISLEVLLLLYILGQRWGGVEAKLLLDTLGRVLLATMLMGLALSAILFLAERFAVGNLPLLLGGSVLGFAVYLGASYLLKIDVLYRLPAAFIGKVIKN